MRVIFYDLTDKLRHGNTEPVDTLAELLAASDVVSLHVPETPETKGMIGAAQIRAMKPGSYFINNARGTVYDAEALARALKDKHLAGAAVDVFPVEPKSNADRFDSPLQGLDNVILTPHVGGSTLEAQERIGSEVARKLVEYSDVGSTQGAVNFPQVQLPPRPAGTRFIQVQQEPARRAGALERGVRAAQREHRGAVSADGWRDRLRGARRRWQRGQRHRRAQRYPRAARHDPRPAAVPADVKRALPDTQPSLPSPQPSPPGRGSPAVPVVRASPLQPLADAATLKCKLAKASLRGRDRAVRSGQAAPGNYFGDGVPPALALARTSCMFFCKPLILRRERRFGLIGVGMYAAYFALRYATNHGTCLSCT